MSNSQDVVIDFLAAYAEDVAVGTPRSLADYQAMFPGFDAVIEKEYRRVADGPAYGAGEVISIWCPSGSMM